MSEDDVKGKFVLEASEVKTLLEENDMDVDTLLQALVAPAATLALPYLSSFYVGAVALGQSGRVYIGGNLEFPGSTLASSVHAEQCLTANLLRHREPGILTVAISAPPCGHCRQFFSEMCCVETMRIIFGEGPKNVYNLADILPHRFGPQDLLEDESQPLLLQEQCHCLDFTPAAQHIFRVQREDSSDDDAFREAATAALEAARRAYSPYTRCPSAVALVSPLGIHCGSIVENAAHNPTLQPLQAAFANARFDGLTAYSTVAKAVLVELENPPLRQASFVQALLQVVAPDAVLHVLHVVEL